MGSVQKSAWVTVLLFASALAMPQLSEKPRMTSQPEMRVDLNSASVEELLQVPGMTRSWAGRIVRFRPYHAKNELLDRGVVTSEVYSRIKEYIVAHRNK
jgi:competence protein ComEA